MSLGGRPLLVVDDEIEMCWILEHLLKRNGLTCETALNGKEAIALVGRQSFCMAFVDAKLPDIDGLELARRIRKQVPSLPIILVSGYFYQDDMTIQKAIESGLISAFFSKPFENTQVLRIIELHALR